MNLGLMVEQILYMQGCRPSSNHPESGEMTETVETNVGMIIDDNWNLFIWNYTVFENLLKHTDNGYYSIPWL